MPPSHTPHPILRFQSGDASSRTDDVVVEEPLELRLLQGDQEQAIAVTMRTPGADLELVRGFLYAEGAIERLDDILSLETWQEGDQQQENVIRVRLRSGFERLRALSRNTFTSSACGVCGTGTLERLAVRAAPVRWTAGLLEPELLCALPERLRGAQTLFDRTGGLHAAGLFDASGVLLAAREDIGRHNAVDKLVGWALEHRCLPLGDHILVVSGRAGYEIAQKAALAGIPVVLSVSAPSSLAVQVAEGFGLTLLGFVREGRFNVYCGAERLKLTLV